MNWKTLGQAILVMVGLLAIITLIALIIYVSPFWVGLAIVFIAGVAVVYRMMEKDEEEGNERPTP